MSLHQPIFYESPNGDFDRSIVELYHELVGRHDHLRESLSIYIKFKEKMPLSAESIRIREALLWFLTIEYYSRFLSDFRKRNNSKRCLTKLLDGINNSQLNDKYNSISLENNEVVEYIVTRRNKYFAHADEVSWDDFPNIFNDEWTKLLNQTADIIDAAGSEIGTQRICTRKF